MEAAEKAQAWCYNSLKSGPSKPCDHSDVQLKGKKKKETKRSFKRAESRLGSWGS